MARRPTRAKTRSRVDDLISVDEAFLAEQEIAKKAGGGDKEDAKEGEGAGKEKDAEQSSGGDGDGAESATSEATGEGQPSGSDEGATTFGQGKAWIAVDIPEDNKQVTVTALSFGGEELKPQSVVDLLRDQFHVKHGFRREALKEMITKAQSEPVARGQFVVAQATPPEAGADGHVTLKFLPDSDDVPPMTYDAVKQSLLKEELEAVTEGDHLSALVSADELLAVIAEPTDGTPGKDVFGTVLVEPGKPADLAAGENVEITAEGFVSRAFGYAVIIKGELSVLPPFWVAGDAQTAHFVHFPQVRQAKAPPAESLVQSLELRGVTNGIQDIVVATLSESLPAATEKSTVLIAQGVAPTDGVDTHVKYEFDAEKRAGKVLEDGTIDFRERNAAIGVAADDFLGEVAPATAGLEGSTVKGESVPAKNGEEKTFSAGQNVRSQAEGEVTKFYAEIDGALNIAGESIDVQPIFTVNGDVNFETGNIDLPTNVDIGGNVSAGFTVKSGGSVTIGGAIENGAVVHARGDIIAAKGIFGEETKVIALGNVETKFIQNSIVMAHEKVTAGAYIVNGVVRSNGEIKVEEGSGPKAGSIIGGEVASAKRVKAKLLGSADTDRTLVGIGTTLEQAEEMRHLETAIAEASTEIPSLVRDLGVTKVDIGEVDALMERVPERRKTELVEPAAKLKELIRSKEEAQRRQDALSEEIDKTVQSGSIVVTDTVFADATIEFGSQTSRVSSDMKEVQFTIGADGIKMRPYDASGESASTEAAEDG